MDFKPQGVSAIGKTEAMLHRGEPAELLVKPVPSGMVRVASSNLAAVGFFEFGIEPAADRLTFIHQPSSVIQKFEKPVGRLEVLFHNGQLWAYEPVTVPTAQALLKAQSIGIYFNEYIKANKDIKAKRLV